MPSIDLVVIARNSATQLKAIYGQADYLASLRRVFDHLWYVDSSSADDSVEVMAAAGFHCLQVGPEGRMSAAASRATAAAQSNADLLFFLDGDMMFDAPDDLPLTVRDYLEARKIDQRLSGFAGITIDVYPDGRVRQRTLRPDRDGNAPSFGGFVALERLPLLAVGNWNGDVVASEELELHARLRRAGHRVRYQPGFSVQHYTVMSSPLHELASAYLPLRPDRYGALGMAVRASAQAGSLADLVCLMPEPFVLAVVLMVGGVAWHFAGWVKPLLLLLGFVAWVTARRGVRFNAVVPALLISMPWGLFGFRQIPVHWRSRKGGD